MLLFNFCKFALTVFSSQCENGKDILRFLFSVQSIQLVNQCHDCVMIDSVDYNSHPENII